jgi:hypothetical protein
MDKMKIKICDFNGRKIDTQIISSKKDLKQAMKKWELKGLL